MPYTFLHLSFSMFNRPKRRFFPASPKYFPASQKPCCAGQKLCCAWRKNYISCRFLHALFTIFREPNRKFFSANQRLSSARRENEKSRGFSYISHLLTTPPLKTPRKGEKCKKYPTFCKKYPNKKLPFTLNFATNRSTSATPCGLKSKTTNKTITINLLLTILPEETFSKGEQKLINYEK